MSQSAVNCRRAEKKHPEKNSGCSSSTSYNPAFIQAFVPSSSVPLPVFSAQVFVVWPAAWAELVQASPPEEACAAPDAGLPEVQVLPPALQASRLVRSASAEPAWLPAARVPDAKVQVAPSAAPEDEPADSVAVGSQVSQPDDSAQA